MSDNSKKSDMSVGLSGGSVRFEIKAIDIETVSLSVAWNLDTDDDTKEVLQCATDGILYLIRNQFEDLVDLGRYGTVSSSFALSLEDDGEELVHEGKVIPFPEKPTQH